MKCNSALIGFYHVAVIVGQLSIALQTFHASVGTIRSMENFSVRGPRGPNTPTSKPKPYLTVVSTGHHHRTDVTLQSQVLVILRPVYLPFLTINARLLNARELL